MIFQPFARVRIINLVDRLDRRKEMTSQLRRLSLLEKHVQFFDAARRLDRGEFVSPGARGCFESHLAILREARDEGAPSLLILEDDFDFSVDGFRRANPISALLGSQGWDVFYGAHLLPANGRSGLALVSPEEPVLTASYIAFRRPAIEALVDFLEAMLLRPAGSPDFGPMHVDGAYTVFRASHPHLTTLAAFPALGSQRSSPSDITPSGMILDRFPLTRPLGSILRRAYNWVARQ